MNDSLRRIDTALLEMQRALANSFSSDDSIFGRVEMSTLWVVDALWRNPTEHLLTITEIAQSLNIEQSTATRFVARAQIAGVVLRIRPPSRPDSISVALTDRGEALARSAERWRYAFLRDLLAGWSDEDRDQFGVLLSRFSAVLIPLQSPEPPPSTDGNASA
ncbi:MAG: hypothetical protein WA880_10355 [Ornithinimicrobium sp.]